MQRRYMAEPTGASERWQLETESTGGRRPTVASDIARGGELAKPCLPPPWTLFSPSDTILWHGRTRGFTSTEKRPILQGSAS
jgi:hypothetical protein